MFYSAAVMGYVPDVLADEVVVAPGVTFTAPCPECRNPTDWRQRCADSALASDFTIACDCNVVGEQPEGTPHVSYS